MASKTVPVTPEVYEALVKQLKPGESLSDVIARLAGVPSEAEITAISRHGIATYQGKWDSYRTMQATIQSELDFIDE